MNISLTFRNLRPLLTGVVALLLGTGTLAGCKKDVVLKTTTTKLLANVEMNVQGGDSLAGSWRRELTPDSTADIRDNRRKLQKVEIERVAYRVNQFVGTAGTTASGTWKLFLSDTPAQVFVLGTMSNLDLAARQAVGTVEDLPIGDDAKAQLVAAVKDGRNVTLVFEGAVSNKPMYALFELQIFTKLAIGI